MICPDVAAGTPVGFRNPWKKRTPGPEGPGVVQLGVARPGEPAFAPLPGAHPASALGLGERLAAVYLWLFPGLMVNAYPWGLSVNAIEPLGPDRTRVRFCTARRRTFGTPSSSRYAFTVLGSAAQALAMAFTSTFLRSKIGS